MRFIVALCFVLVLPVSVFTSEIQRGLDHVVFDDVRVSYGSAIEVIGEVAPNKGRNFKFDHAAAYLRGVRINRRPTLKDLTFHLRWHDHNDDAGRERLGQLRPGQWFRVRGRLMDARHEGDTADGILFVTEYVSIEPQPVRLAEVINRHESFEGIAVASGLVKFGDDVARLCGLGDWPAKVPGCRVAVNGYLRCCGGCLWIEQPHWKLVDLADQIGQHVVLEGRTDAGGWLSFQEHKLGLHDVKGRRLTRSYENVRVSGVLAQQLRPVSHRLFGEKAGLERFFLIRDVTIEERPERENDGLFNRLHETLHGQEQGVFLLSPELSARIGQINHTSAIYCVSRNQRVIEFDLAQPTDMTRQVFARHMVSESEPLYVRLLYAAMLARLNDSRGREFLLHHTRGEQGRINVDAIWLLGAFAFAELAPKLTDIQTETQWAESEMISLMSDHRPAHVEKTLMIDLHYGDPLVEPPEDSPREESAVSDAIVAFSSIPDVLLRSGSRPAHQAVLNYVLARRPAAGTILSSKTLEGFSTDELLQFETITKHPRVRSKLHEQLVRRNSAESIHRFLEDLKDSDEYSRDPYFLLYHFNVFGTRQLREQLRPHLAQLPPHTQEDVKLMLLDDEADPVPELVRLLGDTSWKHQRAVLYYLESQRDPRAIQPVVQWIERNLAMLISDEDGYNDVKIALAVLGRIDSDKSVAALIKLLAFDRSPFATDDLHHQFRMEVLNQLCDLTTESFGLDSVAWQQWLVTTRRSTP